MIEIEFVDGDSDGTASDDELVRQPRKPLPRWAVGAAVAVVVAGFVAAVAGKGDGVPRPAVTTQARPTATPSPSPTGTELPDPIGLGPDLDKSFSSETVLSVAVSGTYTWVLRQSAISLFTPSKTLTSPVPAGTEEITSAQLLVDTRADLAWAVFGSGFGERVVVFRASSLTPQGTIGYRGAANGLAALGGRLYLSVGDRIVSLTPRGAARTVARPRTGTDVGQLVADPSRNRLLVVSLAALDDGDSRLWAVGVPTGTVLARRETRTAQATVAVAATGAIWLAGHDGRDGVLMALDPATLTPTLHSTFDPILAPAATMVAAGRDVIWVRDTGSTLRCMDAHTGDQLQSWSIDGPVGSASGQAVVGYGTRVVTLDVRRCRG